MNNTLIQDPILRVANLKKYFDITKGLFSPKTIVKAVDKVNFEVKRGETFGLVGESGCGKTTLGRTVVKLYDPTDGNVYYKGVDVSQEKGARLKKFRKEVQMIFQDPYASLDPRMTVGEIIREPLQIFNIGTHAEQRERVYELLEDVGLKPDHVWRYPHEFSGGQRQRIGIARALALDPEFIVLDEPISALDVSIQAQIINLLIRLREERHLSYIFVAHDLSIVKYISNRIAVMYLGHIVETGDSNDLFKNPQHPYSKALLSAVLIPDPVVALGRKRIQLEGEIPSPINTPPGCTFASRCPYKMDVCKSDTPQLKNIDGRDIACHLFD
jgi:oligopeptide transport system ATP-binding protein